MTTQAPRGNRLYSLQVLRFFAAFMVLFVHVQHEALSFGFANTSSLSFLEIVTWGSGVDIFFVISGFIMYYVSAKAFGVSGAQGRFFTRRIIRLVPLYWLFTSAMLVAMAIFPRQIAHDTFVPAHIVASYLFVPWLDASGLAHPVLGLGWTLNYEMYFYLVFSFALLLPRRRGIWALVGVLVVLAALNPWVGNGFTQLKFWTDPIILEFVCGIGIAALMLNGLRLSSSMNRLLIGVGAIGLVVGPYVPFPGAYARLVMTGLPAALIVAGCVFGSFAASSRVGRALVLGGDASFALYLSHPFSINIIVLVWQRLGLHAPWLFMLTGIIAAIAGAILVHLLIEKPVTSWLNGWFAARPYATSAPRTPPPMPAAGRW